MIPGFEAIVEQRIQKAKKEGAFDKLEGSGKPLEFKDEHVPQEFRMAHKILKNAGFLPPEIEIKKKIHQTRDLLNQIQENPNESTDEEKKTVQKRLNYLLTKLDTMRGCGSGAALTRDQYRTNIIRKLS